MFRVLLVVMVFPAFADLRAESLTFSSVYDEYKKGNYETVSRLSKKALSLKTQPADGRFFFLYVSTESEWEKLRSTVATFLDSNGNQGKHFWNGLFIFMERSLVLGENELLVKYGKLFQKDGKTSPRYPEALFLLAFGLNELKNSKEASKVLDELETLKIPEKLIDQIRSLRLEIKKEIQN